jgi:hypothetical protein
MPIVRQIKAELKPSMRAKRSNPVSVWVAGLLRLARNDDSTRYHFAWGLIATINMCAKFTLMNAPKRHHYVPRMILNGFTDNDGWLHWCQLDGSLPTIRKARPKELFLEKHLYSTVDAAGIKDPAMEGHLSSLETAATAVVTKILAEARSGQCPILSLEQRQIWYLFFLIQWRRTPETQRAVASDQKVLEWLEDELLELRAIVPNRSSEIDALSMPDARARILQNVRVDQLTRLSGEMITVLERRGIAILRIINPKKSFIVGSRPVVKLTINGQSDLNDPIVEMWLPISSDIAVGVGSGKGRIDLHFLAQEKPIRQLNIAIANQSSTIAAASPSLIRSLARPR